MDDIVNWVKGMASVSASAFGQPRFGIVSSVNPNDGSAKVTLQPENVLTGWLPVLAQWVGGGWGMYAPLMGGEQVLVLPQEGDGTSGVIVGRAWSDQMRPPAAQAGELWFVHNTGSYLKMLNDGTIRMSGNAFLVGNLNVDGNISATGDITDQNSTQGTLNDLRQAYDAHEHPGVQSGGAKTGLTDHPVGT